MDEPGSSGDDGRPDDDGRGLIEQLLLASLGAVAVTADRADRLADELAARGGLERDQARQTVEDLMGRWRGDVSRLGERTSEGVSGFLKELGLVTREEWEELDLRVAQLEHRLRLLEGEPPPRPPRPV